MKKGRPGSRLRKDDVSHVYSFTKNDENGNDNQEHNKGNNHEANEFYTAPPPLVTTPGPVGKTTLQELELYGENPDIGSYGSGNLETNLR